MVISEALITWGIGGIVSVSVAYGYVKGRLGNFVNWQEHREICHDKSTEIHNKIDQMKTEVHNEVQEIMRAIGRIEGKLEK